MPNLKVAVLCGSLQRPSRTLALCEALLAEMRQYQTIDAHIVEISQIGRSLGSCLSFADLTDELKQHLSAVKTADFVIAASPVYSASYTGLFKHFIDFLGMDALAGVPTMLAATGGSPLHGLVIDQQLRPLLAMKQALTLPLGVYAVEADFDDYQLCSESLNRRIALAMELAQPYMKKQGALQ